MFDEIFKRKKPLPDKLTSYGFEKTGALINILPTSEMVNLHLLFK